MERGRGRGREKEAGKQSRLSDDDNDVYLVLSPPPPPPPVRDNCIQEISMTPPSPIHESKEFHDEKALPDTHTSRQCQWPLHPFTTGHFHTDSCPFPVPFCQGTSRRREIEGGLRGPLNASSSPSPLHASASSPPCRPASLQAMNTRPPCKLAKLDAESCSCPSQSLRGPGQPLDHRP